jgi:transposase
MVGEDGFYLLDALDAPATPAALRTVPMLATLRQPWQRHDERSTGEAATPDHPAASGVRFKPKRALPPVAEGSASPYDPEARYRQQRDTPWPGALAELSPQSKALEVS